MPQLSGEDNVLLTDDVIAKEAMRLLKNELVATRLVHRDHEQRFGAIGDTISIKLPARIKSASGRTLVKQPMVDRTTTLKIDNQEHVGLEFNSVERTLALPDFSARYMRSGISQLAHKLDLSILQAAKDQIYHSSGTPGTAIDTDTFIDANADCVELGHPMDGLTQNVLNPRDAAAFRKDLKTLAHEGMVKAAIERSYLGPLNGNKSFETAHMVRHTVGALGGTPLVNGASQTGTTLNIDGATISGTDFLKKGDVFTIANVFSVNPRTYQTTGMLQHFVVTADVDSDGAGLVVLTISPEINDGTLTTLDAEGNNVSLAGFQNVTAAPADNAAITVLGTAATTYRQNLILHRDAVALAVVDIHMPQSAPVKARVRDPDTGLSILMTAQYTISDMSETYRFDLLWGVKTVYPDIGRRIWSAV